MKQSEFNYLTKQDNFKIGFQGALALLIAEIVDANTAEGISINDITLFEKKRRDWAYRMKGADGSVLKFIYDLRPLFPTAETTPFAPFNMGEPTDQLPYGLVDIDQVEEVLSQRIKAGGYINYWADAMPEDNGKMLQSNGQWEIPV